MLTSANPGDLVRYPDGGDSVIRTVVSVTTAREFVASQAVCTWSTGRNQHSGLFTLGSLESVPNGDPYIP
jgi:hypothetical protein